MSTTPAVYIPSLLRRPPRPRVPLTDLLAEADTLVLADDIALVNGATTSALSPPRLRTWHDPTTHQIASALVPATDVAVLGAAPPDESRVLDLGTLPHAYRTALTAPEGRQLVHLTLDALVVGAAAALSGDEVLRSHLRGYGPPEWVHSVVGDSAAPGAPWQFKVPIGRVLNRILPLGAGPTSCGPPSRRRGSTPASCSRAFRSRCDTPTTSTTAGGG